MDECIQPFAGGVGRLEVAGATCRWPHCGRLTARAEGQRIAAIGERKARVELERIMDDRIVCAFIAEANATAERFYGRFPPDMISNVSGLTLSKIIDALYRAGYTARGRRSPPDQATS